MNRIFWVVNIFLFWDLVLRILYVKANKLLERKSSIYNHGKECERFRLNPWWERYNSFHSGRRQDIHRPIRYKYISKYLMSFYFYLLIINDWY